MFTLGMPQALALLLLGEIPQAQASPGNGPAPGVAAPQAVVGGNAGAPAQVSGAPGSAPNPVPAPPGMLQPSEIYSFGNGSNDARYTGVQMREAVIRAGQYDGLQGEFHRQEKMLQQERQARQAAEQQLNEIRQDQHLQTSLQQMGITSQAQPGLQPGQSVAQSQVPAQQATAQQAVGLDAGTGADDGWLGGFGSGP